MPVSTRPATHFLQRYRTGDTVTGVAYTGSGDVTFEQFFLLVQVPADGEDPIDGGEIPLGRNIPDGFDVPYRKVTMAYISLPGVGSIALRVVDPETGTEFTVLSVATDKLAMQLTERDYGVPAGWGVRVVTDGVELTDAGLIYIGTDLWVLPPIA